MSLMRKRNDATAVAVVAVLLVAGASHRAAMAQLAADDAELNSQNLAQIHKQIKPQPGESRWTAIPWLTDLHEARQKAAAAGKPLFLMVSGKGLSIGMC